MTERMKIYQAERLRLIADFDENVKIAKAKFEVARGMDQVAHWLQMVQLGIDKLEVLEALLTAFLLTESQE